MKKKWSHMTAKELRDATKEFDEPMVFQKARTLTQHDKTVLGAARKPGRPKIGQGAEKIRVSIERGLLARADLEAKRLKVSRSELIARGLEAICAG